MCGLGGDVAFGHQHAVAPGRIQRERIGKAQHLQCIDDQPTSTNAVERGNQPVVLDHAIGPPAHDDIAPGNLRRHRVHRTGSNLGRALLHKRLHMGRVFLPRPPAEHDDTDPEGGQSDSQTHRIPP